MSYLVFRGINTLKEKFITRDDWLTIGENLREGCLYGGIHLTLNL